MLRNKVFSLLGATALLATIAACGPAGATADGAASGTPEAARTSPLNEIMGQVWGSNLSQEEQQRRFDEENLAREELIAQCMTQAGFEYIPNPGGATISFSDDNMWRPDDREWVMQYGYGAVRSPWDTQREAENAAIEAGAEVTTDQWFDPNGEMLESLSDSERQAWQNALWGDWDNMPEGIISEDGMVLDEEAFWNHQGCSGQARLQTQADAPWEIMNNDEFLPLTEAMNDFWTRMSDDAQMVAVDREWSSCMADAGHPGFNRSADAQNSIWDEWSTIQNEFNDSIDWEAWDWNANPQGPNVRTTPAAQALADREIDLALVDLDCREAVNLRSRQETIQFAAENQFIADHRAALDALLAAVENR